MAFAVIGSTKSQPSTNLGSGGISGRPQPFVPTLTVQVFGLRQTPQFETAYCKREPRAPPSACRISLALSLSPAPKHVALRPCHLATAVAHAAALHRRALHRKGHHAPLAKADPRSEPESPRSACSSKKTMVVPTQPYRRWLFQFLRAAPLASPFHAVPAHPADERPTEYSRSQKRHLQLSHPSCGTC